MKAVAFLASLAISSHTQHTFDDHRIVSMNHPTSNRATDGQGKDRVTKPVPRKARITLGHAVPPPPSCCATMAHLS